MGAFSPGPVAALAAGVVSHGVLDVVPHWGNDAIFLRVAVVDGLVGLTSMALIARSSPPARRATVLAGMLGACAPDADKPSRLFFGRSPFPARVDDFHIRIQHESPRRLAQEFVVASVGALLVRRVLRGLDPGRASFGSRSPGRCRTSTSARRS